MTLLAEQSDPPPARRVTGTTTLIAVLLTMLLSGCGPTLDEIAVAGIVATPFAFVVGVLGVWAILGLWRDRIGEQRPPWAMVAVALSGVVFVALIAGASDDADLDMVPAFAMVLSGFVGSLSMLGARLRVGGDARGTFVMVPSLVTGLVLVPYFLGWVGEGPSEELWVMGTTVVVALFGTYGAPLVVLGVIVESLVSRRRWTKTAADDDRIEDDDSWRVFKADEEF
jgi:hypothetical protein